jgi:hypothetical protein
MQGITLRVLPDMNGKTLPGLVTATFCLVKLSLVGYTGLVMHTSGNLAPAAGSPGTSYPRETGGLPW